MMNKTNLRIVKMFRQGITLEKIAKRIGRPGDIARIKQALIQEGIQKND